ncbi:MAG: flagellar hook-basal body complex protein FliE [Myxococcota bacterium]
MDAIQAFERLGLSALSGAEQKRPAAGAKPADAVSDPRFADQIRESLGKTNELLVRANQAASDVATGEGDAVEAVLALTKAEVALRHTVAMSSRALEAYREVMRLQL